MGAEGRKNASKKAYIHFLTRVYSPLLVLLLLLGTCVYVCWCLRWKKIISPHIHLPPSTTLSITQKPLAKVEWRWRRPVNGSSAVRPPAKASSLLPLPTRHHHQPAVFESVKICLETSGRPGKVLILKLHRGCSDALRSAPMVLQPAAARGDTG